MINEQQFYDRFYGYLGGVIFIMIIACVILAFMFFFTYKKTKKELLRLTKYDINTRSNIDGSIPNILDLIIDDSFTDYQIMILTPLNEMYITDEREKEIRSDLIYKVTERLSDEAIEKLSQLYNIKNIDKIIADKIYIAVMNYVVNHNKVIDASGLISNNKNT